MEPPVVSYRRFFGPAMVWLKKIVLKCIRWYVRPQTEALEMELARLRKELARLEKQHIRTQAFALNHYRELFRRLEQIEAHLPSAPPAEKAA